MGLETNQANSVDAGLVQDPPRPVPSTPHVETAPHAETRPIASPTTTAPRTAATHTKVAATPKHRVQHPDPALRAASPSAAQPRINAPITGGAAPNAYATQANNKSTPTTHTASHEQAPNDTTRRCAVVAAAAQPLDEREYIYFYDHKKGEHKAFSQFYPSPMKDQGKSYSCAEQFMMAHKAITFDDHETLQLILQPNLSPAQIKSLGRRVRNYNDSVWTSSREAVVLQGNRLKFSQNPELAHLLLSTGDAELAEASKYDKVWGIGLTIEEALHWYPWDGQNLLGKQLMIVREELKAQTLSSPTTAPRPTPPTDRDAPREHDTPGSHPHNAVATKPNSQPDTSRNITFSAKAAGDSPKRPGHQATGHLAPAPEHELQNTADHASDPLETAILLRWQGHTLVSLRNSAQGPQMRIPLLKLLPSKDPTSACNVTRTLQQWSKTHCDRPQAVGAEASNSRIRSYPSSAERNGNPEKVSSPDTPRTPLLVTVELRGEPRPAPDDVNIGWLWVDDAALQEISNVQSVPLSRTVRQHLRLGANPVQPLHVVAAGYTAHSRPVTLGRAFAQPRQAASLEAHELQVEAYTQDRVLTKCDSNVCSKRLWQLTETAEQLARHRDSIVTEAKDVKVAQILRSAPVSRFFPEQLRTLRDWVERDASGKPGGSPRVLITGESQHSEMLALVLQQAGCDVATSHAGLSDTPGIPHYRAKSHAPRVADWDLVVAREERQEGAPIRTQYRAYRPPHLSEGQLYDQTLQPWQYGARSGRAIDLQVQGDLPPLKPTLVVGKEVSNPADSPSLTLGMALAIVNQWLPLLRTTEQPTSNSKQLIASAIRDGVGTSNPTPSQLNVNQLRRRHGRWRALAPTSSRAGHHCYGWMPLSLQDDVTVAEIVSRMERTHSPGVRILEPLEEPRPSQPAMIANLQLAATIAQQDVKPPTMVEELRAIWAKQVQTYVDKDDQSSARNVARRQYTRSSGAGLGWTPPPKPKHRGERPLSRHLVKHATSLPCVRAEHSLPSEQARKWQARFISFQPAQEAKPTVQTQELPYVVAPVVTRREQVTLREYGADYGTRPREAGADPPPHPQYIGGDAEGNTKEFRGHDIAKGTGVVGADHAQCTFIEQFVVARRTGPKRHKLHKSYVVPNVIAKVPSSLADTGAACSVVTTGMLKSLPPGTCVSATYQTPRVQEGALGVDGNPLITEGMTTLVFTLSGHAYEEPFLIVEGEPLILLGNDFLVKHQASITVDDGTSTGKGYMWLNHSTARKPHGRVCVTVRSSRVDKGRRVSAVTEPRGRPEAHELRAIMAATIPHDGRTANKSMLPPMPRWQYGTSAEGETQATIGYLNKPPKIVAAAPTPQPARANYADVQKAPTKASQLYEHALGIEQHLLYSEDAVTIPPRSHQVLWLRAPCKLKGTKKLLMVDRLPQREGMEQIAPAALALVNMNDEGKVPVVVWNVHQQPLTIPAFYPTAQLQVDVEPHREGALEPTSSQAYNRISEAERKLVDSVPLDPDKQLSSEQITEVKDLLARYVRVFAPNPQKPTHTHAMEVSLPMKPDAKPHRHAASRLGDKGREIIDQHTAEMEANGIIRKSNSPWGSRVVLVPKKTVPGEEPQLRFCVDYRDLNSKLETLDSPLPRCDEAIDRLSSGKGKQDSLFLSTLDLASGFWALPLKESDKPKTAFVTHRQKYEFNYLPFGVQSGPSYMARLMDSVLQGIAWEIAMPYLDDIGIWSTGEGETIEQRLETSFRQMLYRLELVLERLLWAGLSAKAKKCSLFGTRIAYLGHEISREGLHMDPAKLSTISNITPEYINTVERVRSFLGLCSYYRKFISKFSQIAGPLHDLTKDGVDVAVESQQPAAKAAVTTLVTALTSEPVVLHTPRNDEIFCVKTDAATTEGLGGVLTQRDEEGRERVIAYYGRRLTPAEKNYTVTEIELLAAVSCIKHWRAYLWGRKFKLIVDHAALKWLHSMKDTVEGGPVSRLVRWILRLQEYKFDVEHKPGRAHSDADGVSRLAAAVRWAGKATKPGSISTTAREYTEWLSKHQPTLKQIETYSRRVIAVLTAKQLRQKEQERDAKEATGHSISNFYMSGGETPQVIREAQHSDPDCMALVNFLLTGDTQEEQGDSYHKRLRWAQREAKHLVLINGMLHHRTTPNPEGYRTLEAKALTPDEVATARLYVPEELRDAYLAAYHDRMGHHGEKRTYQALRMRYYWPKQGQDVQRYVRECHECTMAKRLPQGGHVGLGRPTLGLYPFDDVVCDIVDMTRSAVAPHYDKLLVFVDSLSRWVEAIPLVGSPTAEAVLDILASHIISRHGVPRRLRSDQGSNLTAEINRLVLEKWGITMGVSAAHHHEAVGLAERFNDTLVGMCKAANQGGSHWPEHLPFLLYSYRATPHRVTALSPAMILYGRELNTPAQVKEGAKVEVKPGTPKEIKAYAEHLQQLIQIAWSDATRATLQGQEVSARRAQEQHTHEQFAVGDRVCLRQHTKVNKLQWKWAGPYRVREVLGNDTYRLRDRENNHLGDKVHISNMRRYDVYTDLEPVGQDEYLIEDLVDHRGDDLARREYRVKWRQYPLAQATWEPRTELMRRCGEEVLAYDQAHALPTRMEADDKRKQGASAKQASPTASLKNPIASPTQPLREAKSPPTPRAAKFERGQWWYESHRATARGSTWRWLPEATFTANEKASPEFASLRTTTLKAVPKARAAAIKCGQGW